MSLDLYFWEIWIFPLDLWNAVTIPGGTALETPHDRTHV